MQTYTRPAPIWSGKPGISCSPLVIVSNRAPIEYYTDETGGLRRRRTSGGVTTALTSIAASTPATWIASASTGADRVVAESGQPLMLGQGNRLRLVATPEEAYDLFYSTFCNPLLWFLQHGIWDRLERPDLELQALDAWDRGYLPVNQAIAEAVATELQANESCGAVMLHDYHFYAAPLFIRNLCPGAVLQHFVHVPWPRLEMWQALPRPITDSICEGLLANDSVVFQTESSAQAFLLTCWAFLAAKVDFDRGIVTYRGRQTRVWANPISVDVFDLRSRLAMPEAQPYFEKLVQEAGEKTIVRVDRLDPAKNIDGGLRAFDLLLQSHPEWTGRVRMLAFLVPSRTDVPEYAAYTQEVFALVDEINARHGGDGWTPIKVFHEHNRLQALVALSLYDVLLVNSHADGMNLVSKEGPVLNQRDGVLVLSVAAGSFEELRQGALSVRPEDIEGTAQTLQRALSLSDGERSERARLLRRAVLKHDIGRWLEAQLEDIDAIEGTRPTPAAA